jgi:parvulin-like peptidyl-prolyl isomerase
VNARYLGIVFLAATACGNAATPEASAPSNAGASPEGVQCIEDASAPREAKAGAPNRIEVSHILVRHRDLERPQGATRSAEEACLRALEALKKLEAGAEWDEVVTKYSDAAGATKGSLGSVGRDDLDSQFADAAFSLDESELSYVVRTERGFHIILRER